MDTYEGLARTVQINNENCLLNYDDSLEHVGTGRSAFVFRIKSTMKAMKVYFPAFSHIAKEEAEIYGQLQDIVYYPSVYASGTNFIVIDYIEGDTLFDCLVQGTVVKSTHIVEIDRALSLATARGLNPSDIHLRNIFITTEDKIKIIDVARFRQKKNCRQWGNLKRAYRQVYCKRLFPKRIPAALLSAVAWIYKKDWIPSYRI
ncbi:protein kinase family protein [Sporosarcina luteola]|uniref:protein kinase family protein n=1 Tax=Bacillales TaxID=1385 RepID=UPI00203C0ADA|nr:MULTISPECIES: protein kinase family protein [Bacillales]MCM3637497.1 protein kinase family protein [Sporosarcina luteola]